MQNKLVTCFFSDGFIFQQKKWSALLVLMRAIQVKTKAGWQGYNIHQTETTPKTFALAVLQIKNLPFL